MPLPSLTAWQSLINQCDRRTAAFFVKWLRRPLRTQLSRAERARLIRLFRQVAFHAAGR